jgi:hypothetical protein
MCAPRAGADSPREDTVGAVDTGGCALTLDTYSHVLKGMNGGIDGAMDEALE